MTTTTQSPEKATIVQDWAWTAAIGLFRGTGPQGQRETVARPLMSSPWWTIGDTDPLEVLEGNTSHVYPDGFVVPIFQKAMDAALHVAATHRAPLAVDPEVNYEVWERNLRTGEETRWGGNNPGGSALSIAQFHVRQFNADQPHQDRYESSPTREFFIVETTTTRKRYEG